MKNTVKVIMLPTEDKSNLINDKAIGLQYNSIPLNNTFFKSFLKYQVAFK